MTSWCGQNKLTLNFDQCSIIKKDTHSDKAMSGLVLVEQLDNRCPSVLWLLVPATNHRWRNGGMIAGRGKTDVLLSF